MQGFNTARVLVLDDQLDQAMPVIRALGTLGMAAIYHDGGISTPAPHKLTGIRVMFLDMVLAEHGADANNPEACAAMVAETLIRLVEDSSDPIVVICWTGHENLTPGFLPILKKAFPKSKIDNIIVAEKPNYSAPGDLEKLRNLIAAAVLAQQPVNALFSWEQMVHDAATRTTSEITRLMRDADAAGGKSWAQCGYEVFAALAVAERGSRLADESDSHALKALFSALNPLLSDRLDHTPVHSQAELRDLTHTLKATVAGELAQLAKRKSLLSSSLRAALNSMVHLSPNVAQSELCPGDIFLAGPANLTTAGASFPDWSDVAGDTFLPGTDSNALGATPLVMEFSASCDFAQAKTRLPRFIAGFLVPEVGLNKVKKGDYMRTLGPLLILTAGDVALSGVYYLAFNAHYLLSIRRDVSSLLVPLKRLRTPILADFVAWISSHMSRPGPLHVGP
jgi:hypothetical protein